MRGNGQGWLSGALAAAGFAAAAVWLAALRLSERAPAPWPLAALEPAKPAAPTLPAAGVGSPPTGRGARVPEDRSGEKAHAETPAELRAGFVRFELTVVEGRTGAPLAGAVLELRGPYSPSGVAPPGSPVGRWWIDVPAGESVSLDVLSPGRHPRRVELEAEGAEPGSVRRIFVRLDDPTENLLHVVDREGRPISHARVTVHLGHGERQERSTGAGGWIALPPFEGRGIARRIGGWVEREGCLTSRFDVLQARLVATGGASADPGACALRFMDEEVHRRMDAVVLYEPAVVDGRVLDRDGEPAAGVSIELSLHDWYPPSTCGTGLPVGGSWYATTDAEGRYSIAAYPDPRLFDVPDPESGGPPARRPLKWFLEGPDGALFVPEDELAEGANRRDWRLGPGPRLRGTLIDERGTPLPGVAVGVKALCVGSARVLTDGRGAFELAAVVPAKAGRPDSSGIPIPWTGGELRPLAWGFYAVELPEDPHGPSAAGVTLRPGRDDVAIVLRRTAGGLELVEQ